MCIRDSDYSAPEYKPQRFVRLWRDQDESIIAAADIWPPRGQPGEADIPELFVWFALHPEWRGQGIEDDILAWAHSERELLSQERGEQLILSSMATSTEQDVYKRQIMGREILEAAQAGGDVRSAQAALREMAAMLGFRAAE